MKTVDFRMLLRLKHGDLQAVGTYYPGEPRTWSLPYGHPARQPLEIDQLRIYAYSDFAENGAAGALDLRGLLRPEIRDQLETEVRERLEVGQWAGMIAP